MEREEERGVERWMEEGKKRKIIKKRGGKDEGRTEEKG